MKYLLFIFSFIKMTALMSDVTSPLGEIKFFPELNGPSRMTLNSSGLGIGISPSTNLHVSGNAIVSDQIFIGSSEGVSTLNISGTIGFNFQTITSSTTLANYSHVFVDSSSGNIVINLPDASASEGVEYTIKKVSNLNSVGIYSEGLIDDYSDISLGENKLGSLSVISGSANWRILSIKDADTIDTSNLVAWWKLDETSGSMAEDSSINNNSGNLENFDAGDIGVSSIINNGLDFDGTDDYISLPNSSSFDVGNIVTVSAWVYIHDLPVAGRPSIFTTRRDNSAGSWQFEVGTGNGGTGRVAITSPGQWNAETNNNVLSINQWYHLAFTKSGTAAGETIIYINGESVSLLTDNPQNWTDNTSEKLIGGGTSLGGAQFFDGIIDDVRIYNRALSAAEIGTLYLRGQ